MFARAGAVNHGEEDHLVTKLCEVFKYHPRQKRHDLAHSAKDPVSLSYSSDAASLKCHVQVRASVSGKGVVRKGKDLIGFLLQRGFAKSIISSGRESIAIIIEDPIPLEHGKGAWSCFEAGCTVLPSLRRLGARSVSLHQTVRQGAAEPAEVDVPAAI